MMELRDEVAFHRKWFQCRVARVGDTWRMRECEYGE